MSSKYGVISGLYFTIIGAEITPHLDTSHAVRYYYKSYEVNFTDTENSQNIR